MAVDVRRFGSDLRLLGDLAHQRGRDRGRDLLTAVRPQTGGTDLDRLDGADNLAQALLLRFLTPAGELTQLGHPGYGSRLYELLGELNNQTTRNVAKMYVLAALAAEPRVRRVVDVQVSQSRADPTGVEIAVAVAPIDDDVVLNLVFGFSLAGGGAP
jgi:phage baseplate assembly protein W